MDKTESKYSRIAPHIIHSVTVGSHAYGLATPESDIDIRGVYVAPAEWLWSLDGPPPQVNNYNAEDETVFELGRFVKLALASNPNVLEIAFSDIGTVSPVIREMRPHLLSKRVAVTFRGYAKGQMAKMGRREVDGKPIRWKHAAHVLRLLLSCQCMLSTGRLNLRVPEKFIDSIRIIRDGASEIAGVESWSLSLARQCDVALAKTKLPDQPNRDAVEEIVMRVRRESAAKALEAGQ